MNLNQIFKAGSSCFKSLNPQDWAKGLYMAVGAATLTALQNSIEAHGLKIDWVNIGQAALSAAVVYLIKNYFTGPKPLRLVK